MTQNIIPKVQMGGGMISPKVVKHIQMGGGMIAPKVAKHIKKKSVSKPDKK